MDGASIPPIKPDQWSQVQAYSACEQVGHLARFRLNFSVTALLSGGHLDLDDDGQFLAFGDGFVGDELVAVFGEGEFGRGRAVAHGDSDDLLGGCDDLAGIVEEADFDFLVRW